MLCASLRNNRVIPAARAAASTIGSGLGQATITSPTPAARAGIAVISHDDGSGYRRREHSSRPVERGHPLSTVTQGCGETFHTWPLARATFSILRAAAASAAGLAAARARLFLDSADDTSRSPSSRSNLRAYCKVPRRPAFSMPRRGRRPMP